MTCSQGIQPTTETEGVKFEVIQLIRFGPGILNLACLQSEFLNFLAHLSVLSTRCVPLGFSHCQTTSVTVTDTVCVYFLTSLWKFFHIAMSSCGSTASAMWVPP